MQTKEESSSTVMKIGSKSKSIRGENHLNFNLNSNRSMDRSSVQIISNQRIVNPYSN